MKRYITIGVLLVSTITSSFAQPPLDKLTVDHLSTLLSKVLNSSVYRAKYSGVVRDTAGNVVTSEPSATAQAAAGPGATFDPKTGAVYDAKGNLWDSNAALTAQDVGGPGATLH